MGLPSLLLAAGLLHARPVEWTDLPGPLRTYLARAAGLADGASFHQWRDAVNRETARRIQAGEDEHLAYFLLQSRSFTPRPPIEPALSAREFAASGAVPEAARARMNDFLRALGRRAPDERMRYWQSRLRAPDRMPERLEAAYAAAMRFLYRKEFESAADVYQSRGYSLDTQVEANFAIDAALAVVRRLDPGARLERVLIIGPGLDLAPRTGFRDELPLQSYQPYLTADSLLRWGLARPDLLDLHCADVHPAVLAFLGEFARRAAPELKLPAGPGEPEYADFFRRAGSHLGETAAAPWGKTIRVRRELAARVTPVRLNAVTERLDPPTGYDLVVATNVLLYFGAPELAVALANVEAVLRPGGWFLHNELRPDLEEAARLAGLPPVQGRTMLVAQGRRRPLWDAFVLHRKP